MLGDHELAAAFDDLEAAGGTVTVVLGGTTTQAVRDVEDVDPQLLAELRAPSTSILVFIAAGALPALAVDASCTVDGQSYRVRHFGPPGFDAGLTRMLLVPA